MKTHISIKSIKNGFGKVFRAGYCDLQYIYKYDDPQFYNAGVYGWNCNIYVDYARDIAITTGYRNMAGKLIPSELIHKYSDIARKILEDSYSKSYEDIRKALDENKEAFLDELANL